MNTIDDLPGKLKILLVICLIGLFYSIINNKKFTFKKRNKEKDLKNTNICKNNICKINLF